MSFTLCYSQHHTRKLWTGRYVKLLIVGNSGVVQLCFFATLPACCSMQCVVVRLCCGVQGKTTLCQCLLSVPGSDLKLHDGTATSHQQFLEDPESLCSTVSWDDNTDKVKWVYKVQDTPGTYPTSDLRILQMQVQQHLSTFEAGTGASCMPNPMVTAHKVFAQHSCGCVRYIRVVNFQRLCRLQILLYSRTPNSARHIAQGPLHVIPFVLVQGMGTI